jgi:hypothetical protein
LLYGIIIEIKIERKYNIPIIMGDTVSESIVAPKAFSNDIFLLKCLATK